MAYAISAYHSSHCNPEEHTVGKMDNNRTSHDSESAAVHEPTVSANGAGATPQETTTEHRQPTSSSTNASTDSPASTPLHIPIPSDQSSSGGTSSGRVVTSTVGTPSTVSTAPSTEDDASMEGMTKAGLEKLHLLWEDAESGTPEPPASQWPRPRDRGVPPVVPRVLSPPTDTNPIITDANLTPIMSNADAQGHQNNHRRARSWGEGTIRRPTRQQMAAAFTDTEIRPTPVDTSAGSISTFSLPGAHPFTETHSAFSTNFYQQSPTASPPYSLPPTPPRAQAEQQPKAWGPPVGATPQSRVASFRTDPSMLEGRQQPRYAYPQIPGSDQWQHREGVPRQPFMGQGSPPTSGYHTPPYPPYKPGGYQQHSPPPAGTATPPRPRNPRQQPGQNPHRQLPPNVGGGPPVSSVPTPPRSSSEILKTLLRKKACLYEPETSRAVALVTWMVGRELAMAFGYFSRQQLQSGVHACVAKKIESGAITRTKVNRCMQIILNSCFHYIIPRPDGTAEESGDAFREAFAQSAKDDSHLVRALGPPWDDLMVDREAILKAGDGDDQATTSPEASPRLESARRGGGQPRDGEAGGAAKRTVLLCFNENVRSVEDVFRCHTEFIRDTAHSSKLQLSVQEWRSFFGKQRSALPSDASSTWSRLGVPNALTQPFDSLGQMNQTELAQFRTTWCAKRYDHDHELCGFAHVGVGGGWLRRNPSLYKYKDEMCPSVSRVLDDRWGPRCFVINSCPKGEDCPFAHSKEEIDYHPNRYKSHTCSTLYSRVGGGTPVLGRCPLGDLCPHLHPSEASAAAASSAPSSPPRLPESRSKPALPQQRRSGGRDGFRSGAGSGPAVQPQGAPMLYVDPAPISRFETRLGMPGLQTLYRRHCSVIHAHLRGGPDNNGRCKCYYSNFGDDWGRSFKAL